MPTDDHGPAGTSPGASAIEAAGARLCAAGRSGNPIEIEHAARAYAAALHREWLVNAARRCMATLKAGTRRLAGLAHRAPSGRSRA